MRRNFRHWTSVTEELGGPISNRYIGRPSPSPFPSVTQHSLFICLSDESTWIICSTISTEEDSENNAPASICNLVCSVTKYPHFNKNWCRYVTWSRGMSRMSAMLFLRYWQKQCSNSVFILLLTLTNPS